MDFITPLPTTRNGYTGILDVVCKLSKMIRLIFLPKNVNREIIALLFKKHIYRHYGIPDKNDLLQGSNIHEQILENLIQITEN